MAIEEVKLPKGTELEKGFKARIEIGHLKSGEIKVVRWRFKLKEGRPSKTERKERVKDVAQGSDVEVKIEKADKTEGAASAESADKPEGSFKPGEKGPLIRLDWKGPFVWSGPSELTFFNRPEANLHGVYLWAIPRAQEFLVAGFGITQVDFSSRFIFHTKSYCYGRYAIYDARLIKRGVRRDLWSGFWWNTTAWNKAGKYVSRLASIAPYTQKLFKAFRIFVAPMLQEKRVLERIEAAIYRQLRADPRGAGLLIEDGMKVNPRRPREAPFLVRMMGPLSFLGLPMSYDA